MTNTIIVYILGWIDTEETQKKTIRITLSLNVTYLWMTHFGQIKKLENSLLMNT